MRQGCAQCLDECNRDVCGSESRVLQPVWVSRHSGQRYEWHEVDATQVDRVLGAQIPTVSTCAACWAPFLQESRVLQPALTGVPRS